MSSNNKKYNNNPFLSARSSQTFHLAAFFLSVGSQLQMADFEMADVLFMSFSIDGKYKINKILTI